MKDPMIHNPFEFATQTPSIFPLSFKSHISGIVIRCRVGSKMLSIKRFLFNHANQV